jgi:hypothetical protein
MTAHSNGKKIIALVPARNEEHAIAAFLKTTLELADEILIADQSTDETQLIAESFERVVVIENPGSNYDEAARQRLLIEEARRRHGTGNVLIALDVDEFFFEVRGNYGRVREELKRHALGTSLLFDKPTLVGTGGRAILYGPTFPIGFVDDGREHSGERIHSLRVPFEKKSAIPCEGCGFLHLDLFDVAAHHAKRCYYACLEKLGGGPIRRRWKRAARIFLKRHQRLARLCEPVWQSHFLRLGIRLEELMRPEPFWWDLEVLRLFAKHGCKEFHWEDIWWRDWEGLLKRFQEEENDGLPIRIERPSAMTNWLRCSGINSLAALGWSRNLLRKPQSG